MVITGWKDIKTLQFFSTFINGGSGELNKDTGVNLVIVPFINYFTMYQNDMYDVDHVYQHILMGSVFTNVSHF